MTSHVAIKAMPAHEALMVHGGAASTDALALIHAGLVHDFIYIYIYIRVKKLFWVSFVKN